MRLIRRLWRAIKSRWMLRRLKGAAKMAARWELSSGRFQLRIDNSIKTMLKLQSKQAAALRKNEAVLQELQEATEQYASDLDDWNGLQHEHEVVVKALRDEILVYENSVVPFLTAAHQLALQRIKADIALYAGKEAFATRQEDVR